jgi:hypothetical protein
LFLSEFLSHIPQTLPSSFASLQLHPTQIHLKYFVFRVNLLLSKHFTMNLFCLQCSFHFYVSLLLNLQDHLTQLSIYGTSRILRTYPRQDLFSLFPNEVWHITFFNLINLDPAHNLVTSLGALWVHHYWP